MAKKKEREFYGLTSVGERGQVVIPIEARQAMKLKKGDKLLVLGRGNHMLALVTVSQMRQFVAHLSARLKDVEGLVKKTKGK